jgi:hypothetical protein
MLCLQTVLVDNSPHAYGFQVDNGIPIESWFDDNTDTELLKLAAFLKHVHRVADVRDLVREHFRTYELLDNMRKEQEHQLRLQEERERQQQRRLQDRQPLLQQAY